MSRSKQARDASRRPDLRTRVLLDSDIDPSLTRIGVNKVELPPRDQRAYVSVRYGTPREWIEQVRLLSRFCWPDKHVVVVEERSPDLGSRNRRRWPAALPRPDEG